jgi:replication initiation and membrane attachment protein DnaB
MTFVEILFCVLGKGETTPPQSEKLIDKKMEAFISSLADQFALSPGGIRNLFHKTIVSDQVLICDNVKHVLTMTY